MKWIFEFLIFTSGVGLGFLINYWGWNKSSEIKRLMRDFNQLNRDHRELQTSIDDYFSKTNQLITNLNDTYGALQEHFQMGVETLGKRANLQNQHGEPTSGYYDKSTATSPQNFIRQLTELQKNNENDESVNAPKDYAPKDKSAAGTLSEDFGLKRS